jgi:hypothetical protein
VFRIRNAPTDTAMFRRGNDVRANRPGRPATGGAQPQGLTIRTVERPECQEIFGQRDQLGSCKAPRAEPYLFSRAWITPIKPRAISIGKREHRAKSNSQLTRTNFLYSRTCLTPKTEKCPEIGLRSAETNGQFPHECPRFGVSVRRSCLSHALTGGISRNSHHPRKVSVSGTPDSQRILGNCFCDRGDKALLPPENVPFGVSEPN